MPATIFWDVDTQHDFVMPGGRLYVQGAESILPQLRALIEFARERELPLLGSVDYHASDDREFSDTPDYSETFPPHCLVGTPGQEKVPATQPRSPMWIDSSPEDKEALKNKVKDHLSRGGEILFRKQQFDVFSNPNVDTVLDAVRPDRIVVFGVPLDVCNRFTIEGLLQRQRYRVALVRDASRPIRPEYEQPLIDDWTARGACVLTTEEVRSGALGV